MTEKVMFKTPRGTKDFLPEEMSKRNCVEKIIREVFESYGFQQIQTPIFEEFDLFAARSGETIRDSMFTFFCDNKEYALRPELTAAVCRLIATRKLTIPKPYEVYYVGPCFRYERPQAGRYREFTQMGVELLGSSSPLADAKVIAVAATVLNKLGLTNYNLKIGNIGIFRNLLQEKGLDYSTQSKLINNIDAITSMREKTEIIIKKEFDKEDIEFILTKINELYELQNKIKYTGEFEIKPVKELDYQTLKEWLKKLPKIIEETYKLVWTRDLKLDKNFVEFLIKISKINGKKKNIEKRAISLLKETAAEKPLKELFEVLNWLEVYGIKDYNVVLGVARGLDFYTGTVFEFDYPILGAQKQICGGGRYDNLVEEFGGPKTPATGFAFGFDRIVEAIEKSKIKLPAKKKAVVFVATVSKDLLKKAIEISQTLRAMGIRVSEDLMNLDFRKQIEFANKIDVDYIVIVGKKELEQGCVVVKNRLTKTQKAIKIQDLKKEII